MAIRMKRATGAHGTVQIAKAVIAFIMGGIVVHLVVMVLDYFLMIKPMFLDLRTNFAGSIFSIAMFPMIMAYGLLSLSIYLLWEKKKRALLLAREANLQREKVDAVLKSMQGLTGFLAEHVAFQNSKILSWIELRKEKGQTVSDKIEKPSNEIAAVLQVLSETSFVVPFTERRPANIDELLEILHGQLSQISEIRLGIGPG